MLLCLDTTDKIQVITTVAGDIDVHASYADYDPSLSVNDRVTLGRKNTNITTATTTDVVLAPGSGKVRNVKTLHISNSHASLANVITLQHTDGTTVIEIEKVTLLPGERISYREGIGTRVIDANGAEKTNAAAAVFTKVLASDDANSTVTADKVTGLDFPLTAGVYLFEYYIIYQSAATTTGAKFGVNYTGTNGSLLYNRYDATALATAADGNHDQDILTTTGGLFNVWAARAKSTTAPMISAGVDTANADMLTRIDGIIVVTGAGNLELYSASEVAASAVTVKANSALRLTKIA